jgi:hypothetical protein
MKYSMVVSGVPLRREAHRQQEKCQRNSKNGSGHHHETANPIQPRVILGETCRELEEGELVHPLQLSM